MAEMKAGYKQTDIGIIPEDWDVDQIKNICQISTGDKNTQDRVDSGTYPFFVHSQNVERINSYSFDGEAVLTAGDGVGTGKIFHYINGKFDFHQRVYKMSHFNKRIDGFYFYKYFSNNFYARIMSMTAKSSVDSVRMEMIANMQVPLPKPEEQKQIAAALSDVDGLIEALSQLIAKKRDMKTAAMQQLLTGKKRLPGFDGEWQTPVLEDLADFFKGKFLPKSAISNSGQFSCIHYGELFTHYSEKIKGIRFKTNQPINTSFLSNTNDVLMPTSDLTPNGLAKASCISQNNVILGGDILVIRPKKSTELNGVFLSYFIRFHKDEIMKRVSGTIVYHLYASDIKNLSIDLPGIEEQDAIVSVLEDMSEEIDSLEQRLAKALSLKTGMMHELLTGKTRLIKTNKKQEAA